MTEERTEQRTLKWRKEKASVVCHISKECGTCQYINQHYAITLQEKFDEQIKLFSDLNVGKILKPTPSPRELGYRTHAKLAVRGEDFKIGLFKPGTHDVVSIDNCPLHKTIINDLTKSLRTHLKNSSLTAYDEKKGDVRYISIRVSHTIEKILLVFVITDPSVKGELKKIVKALKEEEFGIESSYINIKTEQDNSIFGRESQLLHGHRRIRESICDLLFEIGPTSFFQVNPWMAEQIYRRIEQHLRPASVGKSVAWDLYCGIGQISLILARLGYRTLGIEANPQATRDAQANAMANDLTDNTHFMAGKTEDIKGDIPEWAWPPSVVTVNPPRTGIQADFIPFLVRALDKNPSSELIYMSCEATSLVRDLALLEEQGYFAAQIEPFDMFPFTDKLEWLCVLRKKVQL